MINYTCDLLRRVGKYNKVFCMLKSTSSNAIVISCRRRKFDHHANTTYHSLDEIPLASKGWTHKQSHGDYFTVHGDPSNKDLPSVPFNNIQIANGFQNVLNENGITAFTTFQSRVIPVIRSGQHTLLAAETGCGKTISYLLPLMEILQPTTALNTPQVLVLVPNRELAYQVADVAKMLAAPNKLQVKAIVGGGTKKMMMRAEHSHVDVMVATPGAIGKLSTVGLFKLHDVKHTVFDEADTLVDDSFVERMESLYNRVAKSQIVFATATMPRKLPAFLGPIMESLVQLKSDRLHRPLLNITQKFMRMAKSAKPSLLLATAHKCQQPMIVFTNRNETCNWLAMFLRENGLKCANINGDMNYAIRKEQWADFTSGQAHILSATDIGSRGLNTTRITQIVNYDFPIYMADYIHRVGRIGRLGSVEQCKVTNFVSGNVEANLVQNIEMAIRTNTELNYVDGNITNIIQRKIDRKMRGAMTS